VDTKANAAVSKGWNYRDVHLSLRIAEVHHCDALFSDFFGGKLLRGAQRRNANAQNYTLHE
jgi:hypothetical protein